MRRQLNLAEPMTSTHQVVGSNPIRRSNFKEIIMPLIPPVLPVPINDRPEVRSALDQIYRLEQ